MLEGDIPTPINPKGGCRLKSRCPKAFEKCEEIEPKLIEVRENHKVACHLYTNI
ncbi:oligopeptide/dipeptide ABC transporter ATP-binding protein [Cetobacterium somerae]|uniref:oligopeptide/dipeptide ABC transporter ATP-binding protein n=1 Tax=Cetobacterium somerae TaxID=188913 RepID=UPI00211EE3C6